MGRDARVGWDSQRLGCTGNKNVTVGMHGRSRPRDVHGRGMFTGCSNTHVLSHGTPSTRSTPRVPTMPKRSRPEPTITPMTYTNEVFAIPELVKKLFNFLDPEETDLKTKRHFCGVNKLTYKLAVELINSREFHSLDLDCYLVTSNIKHRARSLAMAQNKRTDIIFPWLNSDGGATMSDEKHAEIDALDTTITTLEDSLDADRRLVPILRAKADYIAEMHLNFEYRDKAYGHAICKTCIPSHPREMLGGNYRVYWWPVLRCPRSNCPKVYRLAFETCPCTDKDYVVFDEN